MRCAALTTVTLASLSSASPSAPARQAAAAAEPAALAPEPAGAPEPAAPAGALGAGHASGRGFGDGKTALPEDPLLLSGPSWWYGWGLSPSINTSFPQEFVAMAWGARHKGVPLERYLAAWTPHPSTKHLLGFNEPNLRHQSHLSAPCGPGPGGGGGGRPPRSVGWGLASRHSAMGIRIYVSLELEIPPPLYTPLPSDFQSRIQDFGISGSIPGQVSKKNYQISDQTSGK